MGDERSAAPAPAGPGEPVRHGLLHRQGGARGALTFLGAALAVLLVSGAGVVGYAVLDTVGQLGSNAVDISGQNGAPAAVSPVEGGFNLLIVGTDNDAGQGLEFGERDATLNDVNILLHVAADHRSAVAVSMPRDLVVPQPECVNADTGEAFEAAYGLPLNDAYERGGLPCIVNTVAQATGIDIDYAGLVSFNGVIALSDAIGGVPVCLAEPINDPYSGLDLPEGESVISGSTALAFLRTRHGVGDGSDLSRISNQQSFMSSLLRTVRTNKTLGDPVKLYSLARVAAENMTFSTSLADPGTMISLALSLKGIPLDKVVFVQYPVVESTDDPGKVVPDEALSEQLIELLQNDEALTLADGAAGSGVVGEGQDEPDESDGQEGQDEPAEPAETPSATPVPGPSASDTPGETGPRVLEGLRGQSAAENTCSRAFSG